MERIFWVRCPQCACRFYGDYSLRQKDATMICPGCRHRFRASESPEIDERWFS
jgi:hypothetical protein